MKAFLLSAAVFLTGGIFFSLCNAGLWLIPVQGQEADVVRYMANGGAAALVVGGVGLALTYRAGWLVFRQLDRKDSNSEAA